MIKHNSVFAAAFLSVSSVGAFAHDYGRWLCDFCQIGSAANKAEVAGISEVQGFIKNNNDAILRTYPSAANRWVPGDSITVCDGSYCLPLSYSPMFGNWTPKGGTVRDNLRGYVNSKVSKGPANEYRIDNFYLDYTFFNPVPKLYTITVSPLVPASASFGSGASSGFSRSDFYSGYGGGGCVEVDSLLPDGRRAGDVKVGDVMQLGDEHSLEGSLGTVTYSERKAAKGYRILTEGGFSLVCSDTAPIPTKDHGLVLAPELLGKTVAVRKDEGGSSLTGWERVTSVLEVGQIEVQHITVGDKCFWAGEVRGAFLLHHNLKATELSTYSEWSNYWW
jgi:hypothetical protein